MTRITGILALLSIASAHADEPLRMGPDWFSRLKDPQTRIAALYEREKKVEDAEYLQDPEQFAADKHWTFVFPCPQPGKPQAYAVLEVHNWEGFRELSCGLEAVSYPPHPLELQRRREWEAELSTGKAGPLLWKSGQPWMEGVTSFLVDEEGTELRDTLIVASPATIADFDGDGMLDLAEVSREYLKREDGSECYADGFEISALDGGANPKARFYCNVRNQSEDRRTWRFTVRAAASGELEIVLVPTKGAAAEVVFRLTKEGLKETTTPLPADILVDRELLPEDWESPGNFLSHHGLVHSGSGSDHVEDIDASVPAPLHMDDLDTHKWTLPDFTGLSPREAALAIARHRFNPGTLRCYDFETSGNPVPPAKRGWLEKWFDGSGWGGELVTVWWLDSGTARRWTQKDETTFLVAEENPQEIGRRIAISHELDRIRLVPKMPFLPFDDGDSMSGDDIPIYTVRAFSESPESLATTFVRCAPSLRTRVGSRYDRAQSSTLAYSLTELSPETGEPRAIKELAPVWLNPAEIKRTPPALCRAAIRAIGKNRWTDLEPLLLSTKASLGEPSAEEKALADLKLKIDALWTDRRGGYPNNEKAATANERDIRKAERDLVDLTAGLAGNPGFEFRSAVERALKELKEPEAPKRK